MFFSDLKNEHKLLKTIFPAKWPKVSQFKYIPHLLSRREKRLIVIFGLIALIALLALMLRLPRAALKTVPAYGGQYIEGVVGSPEYLNPILAKNNDVDLDLVRLIFSGLMKYDEKLGLVPDLAKSVKVDNNNLDYKVEIKDKIFWHDGQPLTTDDIVFTFEIIKNPQLKNPWSEYVKDIKLVRVDSKNIEFVLQKPLPNFLKILTVGIIPKHIWQNIPVKQFSLTDYNLKPIGSGSWQFKKLARNTNGAIKYYVLERNEKFYDQKPFLSRLTFKFYNNFDDLIKAAQNREISGVGYAPKNIEDQLILTGLFKKHSLQLPHLTAIFFNAKNDSLLNSKPVRKALAYAISRDQILNEGLFGDGQIIQGPILPLASYYNPSLINYDYEPDKATKLLANSGWQQGSDGLWHQGNKTLEISLTTVQQPDLEKVGQLIQKSWQAIGVKTKLITVPNDLMQKEIITPRNYEALLFGVIQGFDIDPYLLWHSSQNKSPGLNLTSLVNPRVNELLEKAQNIPFDDVKKKKYLEFQQIINDELPAIFLYSDSYTYLVDKNIKGLSIEKINTPPDRFNGINNWYIRSKSVVK